MADRRGAMRVRLLWASLWGRRGRVSLAIVAIAIGTSVAAALLNVSRDVERKLTRELRVLGPNLLLLPPPGDRTLDVRLARAQLAREGLDGAPVLYLSARSPAGMIPIAGADLDASRRLHPTWSVSDPAAHTWMGARLADRIGARPGQRLTVVFSPGERRRALTVGARLTSGTDADDQWWIPLPQAQQLAALEGRASLVETRVPGDVRAATRTARALDADGGRRAQLAFAMSATEAGLLRRMQRLMLLVTLAALGAAGLCAFGTLTDLTLERRREIALLKALGATRREIVAHGAAESVAIGLLGGTGGAALGALFAQLIGHRVFGSAVALDAGVVAVVVGLALAVSLLAAIWPLRIALAIEPALALTGE